MEAIVRFSVTANVDEEESLNMREIVDYYLACCWGDSCATRDDEVEEWSVKKKS